MIHTRWLMNRGGVIVTGGSKRIGRAICIGLASAGFQILVHHRNSLEEAEDEGAFDFAPLEVHDASGSAAKLDVSPFGVPGGMDQVQP